MLARVFALVLLASSAVLATSYSFRTQPTGRLGGPVRFEFRAESTAGAKRDVTWLTVSKRTLNHTWKPVWSISGKALGTIAIQYGSTPPNWNTITPPQSLVAGHIYAAFASDEHGGSSSIYFRFDDQGKMTFPDSPD